MPIVLSLRRGPLFLARKVAHISVGNSVKQKTCYSQTHNLARNPFVAHPGSPPLQGVLSNTVITTPKLVGAHSLLSYCTFRLKCTPTSWASYRPLNAAKAIHLPMSPTHRTAAQASPSSRLDSLREALTRANRASKPHQSSRVAEFHAPPAPTKVASHQEELEKSCSETGDYDPADESQEDGNWETDSLGIYETSGPLTDASKKWDDINLPAMCE